MARRPANERANAATTSSSSRLNWVGGGALHYERGLDAHIRARAGPRIARPFGLPFSWRSFSFRKGAGNSTNRHQAILSQDPVGTGNPRRLFLASAVEEAERPEAFFRPQPLHFPLGDEDEKCGSPPRVLTRNIPVTSASVSITAGAEAPRARRTAQATSRFLPGAEAPCSRHKTQDPFRW